MLSAFIFALIGSSSCMWVYESDDAAAYDVKELEDLPGYYNGYTDGVERTVPYSELGLADQEVKDSNNPCHCAEGKGYGMEGCRKWDGESTWCYLRGGSKVSEECKKKVDAKLSSHGGKYWSSKICKNVQKVDGCVVSYNGCGGEGMEEISKLAPFGHALRRACNKHDMCYGCGAMYGWSQKSCDKAFLRDELAECDRKYKSTWRFFSYRLCQASANVYYHGVRAAGDNFMPKTSRPYCKQACAKKFGDPSRKVR